MTRRQPAARSADCFVFRRQAHMTYPFGQVPYLHRAVTSTLAPATDREKADRTVLFAPGRRGLPSDQYEP